MKLAPARLLPVFLTRIWGRRSLAPLFSEPASARGSEQEPIGEVWLTGEECEFAADPLGESDRSASGLTLGRVWPTLPEEWTGRRFRGTPRIPLLVKFIFPDDKLSVQVHPNDEYARQHEAASGGVGKTEMWYAVAAEEGAELRLGLESGVTRESFRRAMVEGTVERCLRRLAVRAGDAFFVPAGTAHTIGGGLTLCEVQQQSDITYRVFDYGRVGADGNPRTLHQREALEVINFGEQAGGRAEPAEARRGPLRETYLAACKYFAVERWEFAERAGAATSPERFELLVVLAGRGRIECGGEAPAYAPGEVWFLPAALGVYELAPQTATVLLRAYVPDLEEVEKRMAARQIDEAARARVVHR